MENNAPDALGGGDGDGGGGVRRMASAPHTGDAPLEHNPEPPLRIHAYVLLGDGGYAALVERARPAQADAEADAEAVVQILHATTRTVARVPFFIGRAKLAAQVAAAWLALRGSSGYLELAKFLREENGSKLRIGAAQSPSWGSTPMKLVPRAMVQFWDTDDGSPIFRAKTDHIDDAALEDGTQVGLTRAQVKEDGKVQNPLSGVVAWTSRHSSTLANNGSFLVLERVPDVVDAFVAELESAADGLQLALQRVDTREEGVDRYHGHDVCKFSSRSAASAFSPARGYAVATAVLVPASGEGRRSLLLAGGTHELGPDEEARVKTAAGCLLEPHGGGPAFASPGEARHTALAGLLDAMRAGAAGSP